MKEKCIQWIKHRYQDIIAVLVITLLTGGLLTFFYDLGKADFNVPFTYVGDGISVLIETKMTAETGWNTGTDLLAAPETFNNAASIISGMHNADVLTSKIFLLLSGNNVAYAVNMTFLSTFFLIAYIAYAVLRTLKIRPWISTCGAMTYAFLAFIFCRGIGHLVLSCYYFIPMLVLICLWIYEDEQFLLWNRQFFHNKKNIAAIIMFFCIANSGIMYWQFFGCFFLCVTMFSCLLKTKNFDYLKKGFTGIVCIVVFMMLGAMPEVISLLGGGSGIEGRYRSIVDSEIYGLKIIQLFLPMVGHGIEPLQHLIDSYNSIVPSVTENSTAYLGIVGIIGFLILLVVLFRKKSESDSLALRRLSALAELNLCAVLFGTMGGFGTVFFIFISPTLRGFNRISVYIAFFSIAAVCIILEELTKKIQTVWIRIVVAAGASILFLLGIYEQNPQTGLDYEGNKIQWESDKKFVADIENQVEHGSMIFELPYHDYPEGGPVNQMMDYEQFMGYIHSDHLRWSYGITVDTELDSWYYTTASYSETDEIGKMIAELKNKGFAGIALDREAYIEMEENEETGELEFVRESYSEIEDALVKALGGKLLVSDNEKWSFIAIK